MGFSILAAKINFIFFLQNSLSYIHLFRELAWWKAASIWTMSTALIRTTVTALSISICLRRRWQATTHVKYLPFRMTWQPRKGWPSTVSKRILSYLITIDLCLILNFLEICWFKHLYIRCLYSKKYILWQSFFCLFLVNYLLSKLWFKICLIMLSPGPHLNSWNSLSVYLLGMKTEKQPH